LDPAAQKTLPGFADWCMDFRGPTHFMHNSLRTVSGRIVPIAIALAIALVAGCSKSPEQLKAEQEAQLAKTTGTLVVKANLADATLVAKPAEGAAPSAYEGAPGRPFANLPPGRYVVTGKREGWPEARVEAAVQVGQTTEATLNFPSGSLRLDTVPTGANVRLGAATLGKTPLVIPQLPAGECALSFEYASWPLFPQKVTVVEKQETATTVRLPHGRAILDSIPSGATVLAARSALGKTPLTLDPVPAGPRKYTFQLKGFPTIDVTLTVVDGQDVNYRPALGAFFPALDPSALLREVWIPDDPSKITTGFNATTGIYRPKNDVVKNIHRETLYNRWLNKTYKFSGAVKTYDAASGRLEFAEQKNELTRFRVIAQLPPGTATPVTPLPKDAVLSLYGLLSATEEPVWPGRVVTLEISDAALLPEK
jgi:hypothetical protein